MVSKITVFLGLAVLAIAIFSQVCMVSATTTMHTSGTTTVPTTTAAATTTTAAGNETTTDSGSAGMQAGAVFFGAVLHTIVSLLAH